MIELEFCKKNQNERQKIVEEFRKINLDGRRRAKISQIDKWCTKYLNNVEGKSFNFNSIIEALPNELIKLKEYMDTNYDVPKIMKELPHTTHCYIETSLYDKMKSKAKLKLLQELNVSVCPYCNRNYIFSDQRINTCELDHFIPKRKYPIFASSFYNLIPSCSYCNGKKGENEFCFFPHYTKKETDDLIKFTYKILGSNYLTELEDLDLDLKILDSRYLEQAKVLKLEEIYNHHKDIVQDVLKKRQIFSDAYLKSLGNEFSVLFDSPENIKELIYGVSMNKKDYGKRPLTKMIQDIVNEVNDI